MSQDSKLYLDDHSADHGDSAGVLRRLASLDARRQDDELCNACTKNLCNEDHFYEAVMTTKTSNPRNDP